MQKKLLHKILNFVLNHNFFNLNKNSKILQVKFLCIYHKLTMEVSLSQIINTKKHTKTSCLCRVSVEYINRNILQFYKGYFTSFYQMKALEICNFVNFLENLKIFV